MIAVLYMKKAKILFPLFLLFGSFSLQGCAKTMEAKCYAISKVTSNLGIRFSKSEVHVYDGSMTAVTIEETYSPSCWARLSKDDALKLGEENVVEVKDAIQEDGSSADTFFAKYIKVCGDVWVGSLRDDSGDDEFYNYNEYVQYSSLSNTDEAATDILRYLSVQDATTYQLGSRVGIYYEEVIEGNNKILKATSGTGKDVKTEESSVSPYYPKGKRTRIENDSDWKASITALSTYLTGKKLNYKERVSDDDLNNYDTLTCIDRTWYYNPELISYDGKTEKVVEKIVAEKAEKIEGCTYPSVDAISINSYFTSVNKAFASVEYASIS